MLDEDREKGIEGLDEKNRLEISAIGSTVVAKVNGKRLDRVQGQERRAGQRPQDRRSTYGDRKRSKKAEGVALFDNLKVQVPTP